MRVGFLVWNQFQVGHFAELAAQFHEPDFIFTDRDRSALKNFDPAWLTRYGAYTRFIRETELYRLDGRYDVILTQFTPPLRTPWKKTKMVMCQYSMAKPKTAYNARWLASDFGLVYGQYSNAIIGQMCPTAMTGNPRFDAYFEGRLDPNVLGRIRARLDPDKKTVLFLPTWGDLSSRELFSSALGKIARQFNVLYRPHHLTTIRESRDATLSGVICESEFEAVLDIGPYFMSVADCVVSDMSGAIFDGLYCGKPVVLMALGADFTRHKKAEPTALEIAKHKLIGPRVKLPKRLPSAIGKALDPDSPWRASNVKLAGSSFAQRGGCAPLAAEAVRRFVAGEIKSPPLHSYAAPSVRNVILKRAYATAQRRAEARVPVSTEKVSWVSKVAARAPQPLKAAARHVGGPLLSASAGVLERIRLNDGAARMHKTASKLGQTTSVIWRAERAQETGDVKAALALYRKAAPDSNSAKRAYIRLMHARGDFMSTGYAVEAWLLLSSRLRTPAFLQYTVAASAIRFSQRFTRRAHTQIHDYWAGREPGSRLSSKARILRALGFVRAAQAVDGTEQDPIIEALGDLVDQFELGAANELVERNQATCITPDGSLRPLAECPPSHVFEMVHMRNFTRTDFEISVGMREVSIQFTRAFSAAVRARGYSLFPRIQSGARAATMISGDYRCMTWHTVDVGVRGQIHAKIGSLPGHVAIDTAGYAGWATLASRSLDSLTRGVRAQDAERQFEHLTKTVVAQGASKFVQSSAPIPDVAPYVFLPMQILNDTVARHAHIDTLRLLRLMAEWIQESELALVVKRHPKCKFPEVAHALAELEAAGRIIISDAGVHDLIAGADLVVTVNSGVGAEALLQLKPVITTGRADYGAATVQVRNRTELLRVLNHGDWRAGTDLQIKKFLWYYTKRYMPHFTDTDAIMARVASILPVAPKSRMVQPETFTASREPEVVAS